MDATKALEIIRTAIRQAEAEAYEADCNTMGVLAAQNARQGHDNLIRFGSYDEAVENLHEFGTTPDFASTTFSDDLDDPDEYLSDITFDAEVGTGEPIAYVGVEGYYALIRTSATEDEIRAAAQDCLPLDNPTDD
jgi:hypothetical protein